MVDIWSVDEELSKEQEFEDEEGEEEIENTH